MTELSSEPAVIIEATLSTADKMTLVKSSEMLAGLNDYVRFCSYLELSEAELAVLLSSAVVRTDREFRFQLGSSSRQPTALDVVNDRVDDAVALKQLSYENPIELVVAVGLTVGTLSGVGYYIASRAIDVFNRFQEAREIRARTNYHLGAYEFLQDQLDRERFSSLGNYDSAHETVLAAAEGLETMERLVVQLPEKRPERTLPKVEGPDDPDNQSFWDS
jgi:hypothetical protein